MKFHSFIGLPGFLTWCALCPVINKALLKEDNNGNSPIVIVDFPRDSQLRQGRGRSLMPLIQYQVPGESYRAKNPTLLSYRSDRGKGLTRTEQVLSRSSISAEKHLRTFPLLRWMTHYWNYAITGWDYSTTGTDLLIQREQRLTVYPVAELFFAPGGPLRVLSTLLFMEEPTPRDKASARGYEAFVRYKRFINKGYRYG
ncbi:hypothetical protein QYF36_027100 [Acer negundo]|nr:hypothetical protein QYF36_027100 [Acer negundo]